MWVGWLVPKFFIQFLAVAVVATKIVINNIFVTSDNCWIAWLKSWLKHTTTNTQRRIICYASNAGRQDHRYDTDSVTLRIDNCCTMSVTTSRRDFIDVPMPITRPVDGIAGGLEATHVGTVKWLIEDDQGVTHEFILPGTLLVKDMPSRFLSPQHWVQTAQE